MTIDQGDVTQTSPVVKTQDYQDGDRLLQVRFHANGGVSFLSDRYGASGVSAGVLRAIAHDSTNVEQAQLAAIAAQPK